MKPILFITQFAEDDTLFHVDITHGADQINDEIELTEAMIGTLLEQKGGVKAIRLTESMWEVRTRND